MNIEINAKKLKAYAKENPSLTVLALATALTNGLHNFDFVVKQEAGIDTKEVVEYLNMKTGKNFRPSSAATKKLIQARAKEGFTMNDFKAAIDHQCACWTGEMTQYLRPETLFGTKMESYVNNVRTKEKVVMDEAEMFKLMED